MTIEWFRDLVLIIFGLGATAVLVFLAVLAYRCYRRLKPALESLGRTAATIEGLSSAVEREVAGPLGKVISFVQGVRQAIGLVKHFTGKEED